MVSTENATPGPAADGPAQLLQGQMADTLREEGNRLFREGQYAKALSAYERCLAVSPQNVLALSNNAAAHAALGDHLKAWQCAKRAAELDPGHLKSRFRRGTALMKLHCYAGAVEHLQAAHQMAPQDDNIRAALKEAQHLLQGSQGVLDLRRLYDQSQERMPLANFVGPVRIAAVPGCGRGVVVTRDVKAGELLLVENALVSLRENPLAAVFNTPESARQLPMAELVRRARAGPIEVSQVTLAPAAVQASLASPLTQQRLSCLYDGSAASASCIPDISLFVPYSSEAKLQQRLEEAERAVQASPLDVDRLKMIFRFNAWDRKGDAIDAALRKASSRPAAERHNGIWSVCSFINHSCALNTSVLTVGNAFVVRAGRDLAAGEELYNAYNGEYVRMPLAMRRANFLRVWGFNCKCKRCQVEEQLPSSAANLINIISAETSLTAHPPGAILQLFRQQSTDALRQTYRKLSVLLGLYERALDDAQLSEEERGWCRMSISNAYRLAHTSAHFLGGGQTGTAAVEQAGAWCLSIEAAAFPGSINHVAQAAMDMCDAAYMHGRATRVANAAQEHARRVARLRYGAVTQALADDLLVRALPGGGMDPADQRAAG